MSTSWTRLATSIATSRYSDVVRMEVVIVGMLPGWLVHPTRVASAGGGRHRSRCPFRMYYGKNYTSHLFRAAASVHGIALKLTRPYRPQTNGKAEAFIKILQNEWAYARKYLSNNERLGELERFMRYYNHRRPHGGIEGAVPASRL